MNDPAAEHMRYTRTHMNATKQALRVVPGRFSAALMLALAAGLASLMTNCDKQKSSATAAASASASSAPVASATVPPPPPVPPPSGQNNPAVDPMPTLFGRMEVELKSRPNVHPNVEDGLAVATKAGANVPTPQQSLASTYKAAFCRHGVTDSKEMSVLFCEYPDEAHTAAGLVEANKLFPGMKTRHTYAKKTLLMVTIFQTETVSPATTNAQKALVTAFNAM